MVALLDLYRATLLPILLLALPLVAANSVEKTGGTAYTTAAAHSGSFRTTYGTLSSGKGPRYTNSTQASVGASTSIASLANSISGSGKTSSLGGTAETQQASSYGTLSGNSILNEDTLLVPSDVPKVTVISGVTATLELITGSDLPTPITLYPLPTETDYLGTTISQTASKTSQSAEASRLSLGSDILLIIPQLRKITRKPKATDGIGPVIKRTRRLESSAKQALENLGPKPSHPGDTCVSSIWNLLSCVVSDLQRAVDDLEDIVNDIKDGLSDLKDTIIPELIEWADELEKEDKDKSSSTTGSTATSTCTIITTITDVVTSCYQTMSASSITNICTTSSITSHGCDITAFTTATTSTCRPSTASSCAVSCFTSDASSSCTTTCSTSTAQCATDAATTSTVAAGDFPELEQYVGADVDSAADIEAMAAQLQSLFVREGLVEYTATSFGTMAGPSTSASNSANRTSATRSTSSSPDFISTVTGHANTTLILTPTPSSKSTVNLVTTSTKTQSGCPTTASTTQSSAPPPWPTPPWSTPVFLNGSALYAEGPPIDEITAQDNAMSFCSPSAPVTIGPISDATDVKTGLRYRIVYPFVANCTGLFVNVGWYDEPVCDGYPAQGITPGEDGYDSNCAQNMYDIMNAAEDVVPKWPFEITLTIP